MTKEEQVEELVYWIVECMDMDALFLTMTK